MAICRATAKKYSIQTQAVPPEKSQLPRVTGDWRDDLQQSLPDSKPLPLDVSVLPIVQQHHSPAAQAHLELSASLAWPGGPFAQFAVIRKPSALNEGLPRNIRETKTSPRLSVLEFQPSTSCEALNAQTLRPEREGVFTKSAPSGKLSWKDHQQAEGLDGCRTSMHNLHRELE